MFSGFQRFIEIPPSYFPLLFKRSLTSIVLDPPNKFKFGAPPPPLPAFQISKHWRSIFCWSQILIFFSLVGGGDLLFMWGLLFRRRDDSSAVILKLQWYWKHWFQDFWLECISLEILYMDKTRTENYGEQLNEFCSKTANSWPSDCRQLPFNSHSIAIRFQFDFNSIVI